MQNQSPAGCNPYPESVKNMKGQLQALGVITGAHVQERGEGEIAAWHMPVRGACR
jgi:hypothetical protein